MNITTIPTDGPNTYQLGTCGHATRNPTTGQVTACGDPATWHVALIDLDESVAACNEHIPFAARGCDDWHHYGPDCAQAFTAWRYGTGRGTGHCEPVTDTK